MQGGYDMTIEEKINGLAWNKKLEILRRINNWTQEEAADKCNATQKMYWSWEKARSYPRKTSRRSIARAYRISEEDIFSN